MCVFDILESLFGTSKIKSGCRKKGCDLTSQSYDEECDNCGDYVEDCECDCSDDDCDD